MGPDTREPDATRLVSFGWRVAAVASTAGFWIDRAAAPFLPGSLGHRAATERVGSPGLVLLFLLLIVRNLLLALPMAVANPAQLREMQQEHGIYDDREFPETRAAREAIIVCGGLSLLLALGWMAGDPPFRRSRVGRAGLPTPALTAFSRVRLSGTIEINGVRRRVRDERVVLQVDEGSGQRSFVFFAHKAGAARPLGLEIPVADIVELETGQAYGTFVPRPGVRFRAPSGLITIGFESLAERDAALTAIGAAEPAPSG